MTDNLHLDIAAKMPWLRAKDGSWWVLSGEQGGGTFTTCLAQAMPAHVTGEYNDDKLPIFQIQMMGLDSYFVRADRVTQGREVVMVWKDCPVTAVHPSHQFDLEVAMERVQEGK